MKRILICGAALANLAIAAPAFARSDVAVMARQAPMTQSEMSEMTSSNTNHSHVMMMIELNSSTMAKLHKAMNGGNLYLACQENAANPNAISCYQSGSVGG